MTPDALALYNWRKQNDMTQQQAASWLGVSFQTIANIERGRTNPSKKTLARMRKVIGEPPEQVAEENAEPHEKSSYVPFTERLAAAYPDLQKKFDEETKNEQVQTDEIHARPEILRLIGFFEGIAAATKVDMSKQIAQLESLLL